MGHGAYWLEQVGRGADCLEQMGHGSRLVCVENIVHTFIFLNVVRADS